MAYGAILGQQPPPTQLDAQDVNYSGTATGTNVKEALDGLKSVDDGLQETIDTLSTTVSEKARMQIVSYVGTGTYGVNNPCSITADFPIKAVIYLGGNLSGSEWRCPINGCFMFSADSLSVSYKVGYGFYTQNFESRSYGKISNDGKTITWYNTSGPEQQINNPVGTTFYFLCIG